MQIRDLSIPVDEETIVPPGLPSYRQGGVVRNDESDGYESDFIATTIHVGTHVDAPLHFDPDGTPIGDIAIEDLVRPTKLADVRQVTRPEEPIRLEAIEEALSAPLEAGEYLFVRSGWADEHIYEKSYYLESPYYEPAVSEFVVESGARGLITDTPIDPGNHGYPNHFTLCENGKVIVENVAELEGLPQQFTTWVVPVKLARGEGAPARVFIVEEGP
jgi:kynurenine formamidase